MNRFTLFLVAVFLLALTILVQIAFNTEDELHTMRECQLDSVEQSLEVSRFSNPCEIKNVRQY